MDGEPTELDILLEFQRLCKKVDSDIGKDMLALTEKNVLSYEDYKDVVITSEEEEENWEKEIQDDWDVRHYLGEAGCPICQDKEGKLFLGDCSEPTTGAGCSIDIGACARRGGVKVGSFHTHPMGGNTPSVPDMECARSGGEKIFCIGGLIGHDRQISCYALNQRSQKHGIIYNPFTGSFYKDREEPAGIIRFYREPPPPTASDLLADLDEKMIRDIIEHTYHQWREEFTEEEKKEVEDRVKEFRASLERGEIPDEYWEQYGEDGIEGEMDELNVFTPDQIPAVEKDRKEFLKNFLFICEMGWGQ